MKPDEIAKCIPDEVVEAALFTLRHSSHTDAYTARLALAAGLAAWPKIGSIRTDQPIGEWVDKLPAIILPLKRQTANEG